MKYLFLDDERMPRDVTWVFIGGVGAFNVDWKIVRSYDDAVLWVELNGIPDVISFDHDLGEEHYGGNYSDKKTGYDFAKWLIEHDMETKSMPENFRFTVHSMNPVGAENIRNVLNGYLIHKKSL